MVDGKKQTFIDPHIYITKYGQKVTIEEDKSIRSTGLKSSRVTYEIEPDAYQKIEVLRVHDAEEE